MEVIAPGFVSRLAQVRWEAGTRDGIGVIRETPPFSMSYYREFVRNLLDNPGGEPEILRRWTTAPNFYIDTRKPTSGEAIPEPELQRLITILRESVPQLTGGRLEAGTIESGAAERAPRLNYINVKFFYEPEGDRCGWAYVAANPGEIQLSYGDPECGTRCGPFAWRTVAHEVGHAMGFWHASLRGLMNTSWTDSECDRTTFSADEQYHARIAYSRPFGNRDPDIDPATAMLSQTDSRPIRVNCR